VATRTELVEVDEVFVGAFGPTLALSTSGGTVPGKVVCTPSGPGGACAAITSVMSPPQSPPCATNCVYPRRFISTTQARAVQAGPSRSSGRCSDGRSRYNRTSGHQVVVGGSLVGGLWMAIALAWQGAMVTVTAWPRPSSHPGPLAGPRRALSRVLLGPLQAGDRLGAGAEGSSQPGKGRPNLV
jgi:hypothetical protein